MASAVRSPAALAQIELDYFTAFPINGFLAAFPARIGSH